MFPIGWMYYFGVNLDTRFNVPDFWPKPEETHRIPFERDEQLALMKQLREARLERRRRRLELEEKFNMPNADVEDGGPEVEKVSENKRADGHDRNRGWGVGSIERWARGR